MDLVDVRKLAGYESIAVVFIGNKTDLNVKREVVFSDAESCLKQAGVREVLECTLPFSAIPWRVFALS